jgi:hypothetical protein
MNVEKNLNRIMFNIIFIISFSFTSCKPNSFPINSIWVPAAIEWQSTGILEINQTKTSSFNILVFEPFGGFYLFSSTQALSNDSIFVQYEPGIVMYKGVWSIDQEDKITMEYKTSYQTLKLQDENTIFHENVFLLGNNIVFQGVVYEQTNKLSIKSRDRIKKYVEKMDHEK